MTIEQIRKKYGVPAKRGMVVEVENGMKGKIVGSYGLYLQIRVFDRTGISSYHPTWKIKYPVGV